MAVALPKGVVISYDPDAETLLSIHDNLVRADWVDLGEGFNGDYNPDDPDDEPFLRFDVYVNTTKDGNPENWEAVDDASYCTYVSAISDYNTLLEKLFVIFNEYRNVIDDYPICVSVKKLGETLSHI